MDTAQMLITVLLAAASISVMAMLLNKAIEEGKREITRGNRKSNVARVRYIYPDQTVHHD